MASDPYWISNPTERALIDAWRAMPDDQRQAFAILAETRKLQKLQRSARRAAYRSSDNATFRIDWQRHDA